MKAIQTVLIGAAFCTLLLTNQSVYSQWQNGTDIYNLNSGEVGIGTTAPVYLLDILNDSTTRALNVKNIYAGSSEKYGFYNYVTNTGSGARNGIFSLVEAPNSNKAAHGIYSKVTHQGSGVAYGIRSYVNTTGSGVHYGIHSEATGINNYSFYGLGRGYFSDNVGLGTTSPDARLEIEHNSSGANPQLLLYESGDDFARLNLKNSNSSSYWTIAGFTSTTNASERLHFYNSTTGNILSITGNGNVGIGISSPVSPLQITDAAVSLGMGGSLVIGLTTSANIAFDADEIQARKNGAADFVNLNPLGGTVTINNSGTTGPQGSLRIGNIDGNNVQYRGDEIQAMNDGLTSELRLNPSGSPVYIGTSGILLNPEKLNVCGSIKATEIRVEASWCDYVFDKNYKLMPLQQVSDYIKKYRHLPNIPTAAQVESNGLQLGDMSRRMMEKIEELTIYIIQLHDQIQLLELKNKELETCMQSSIGK